MIVFLQRAVMDLLDYTIKWTEGLLRLLLEINSKPDLL